MFAFGQVISDHEEDDTNDDIYGHSDIYIHAKGVAVGNGKDEHREHRNEPDEKAEHFFTDVFSFRIVHSHKKDEKVKPEQQQGHGKHHERLAAPAICHIVIAEMCGDGIRQAVPEYEPCQNGQQCYYAGNDNSLFILFHHGQFLLLALIARA